MSISSFAYNNGYYDEIVVKNSKEFPKLAIYTKDMWFLKNEIVKFDNLYDSANGYARYKNKDGVSMIINIRDLELIKTNIKN